MCIRDSLDGSSVLLTNAFINAEERLGDFRVDAIASSGSDVRPVSYTHLDVYKRQK